MVSEIGVNINKIPMDFLRPFCYNSCCNGPQKVNLVQQTVKIKGNSRMHHWTLNEKNRFAQIEKERFFAVSFQAILCVTM